MAFFQTLLDWSDAEDYQSIIVALQGGEGAPPVGANFTIKIRASDLNVFNNAAQDYNPGLVIVSIERLDGAFTNKAQCLLTFQRAEPA